MKVLNYQAHNVGGIKEIDFQMEGHHLFTVGGKNAQGKTSALNALKIALAGRRGMDDFPEVVLRDGQKKGSVTVELSGATELHEDDRLKVEFTLRRKPSGKIEETFRVLDSTGEEAPEPKTLLRRLFKMRGFDPLSWYRKSEKEQHRTLTDLAGLNLDEFDSDYEETYQKRTGVGRDGKRLAASLEAIPLDKDAPSEEVSITALMSEMESSQQFDSLLSKAREAVEHKTSQVDAVKAKVEYIKDQQAKLKKELKLSQQLIETHEAELTELNQSLSNIEEGSQPRSIESIKSEIANADKANASFRRMEERKKVEKDLKEARNLYELMTDRLEEIKSKKLEALESAPLPVEGLQLTENGVLWNGLPFSQASTMQRILASTRIGMAANPTLRLLVCESGSDLDLDSLQALEKICKEADFQMIIELVTRSETDEDRCAVVIENGVAR